MSFLGWILVGLIAGWATGKIMRGSGRGVFADILIGIAGAIGVGQLLQSILVAGQSRDVITLLAIAGVMIAVSVVACLMPARRATQLDPVSVLR